MKWTLPLGITIGTFIGLYIANRSLSQSVFGAIFAFAVSCLLSIVWAKREARK